MAFIPAADTAKVIVKQVLFSQTINNTFHVRRNGGFSTAQLAELATRFITFWNDQLAGHQSDDLRYISVQARDMSQEEAPGVEVAFPANSGGDVVNPSLPGNVALAVKLVTGLTGRNRRGRVFIAGIPEGNYDGNTLQDAVRTAMTTDFNDFIQLLQANGYEMVIASFYNGTQLVLRPNGETRRMPIPRAAALITPVENAVIEAFLDSQRRRLTGRGA